MNKTIQQLKKVSYMGPVRKLVKAHQICLGKLGTIDKQHLSCLRDFVC